MGHEVTTDREYIQTEIIPRLQEMMVADWDNFEDPRLATEELYTKVLEYLNPPEQGGAGRARDPLASGGAKKNGKSSRICLTTPISMVYWNGKGG